jgi:hypothetical protein
MIYIEREASNNTAVRLKLRTACKRLQLSDSDKQDEGRSVVKKRHILLALFLRNSNIVGDGKDYVYDGEHIDSENIGQFERNPHLETTTRARLDPKHVDERTRIVQETTNKIS